MKAKHVLINYSRHDDADNFLVTLVCQVHSGNFEPLHIGCYHGQQYAESAAERIRVMLHTDNEPVPVIKEGY